MSDQELMAWEAGQVAPEQAFYVTLGLFTHKFGNVDMQLTRLHAHLLGARDFEAFAEKHCDRVAAGTRAEKIVAAARAGRPMGPRFEARFSIYQNALLKLRNRLMHDEIIAEGERLRLIAIDRFNPGRTEEVRPNQKPERVVCLRDLRAAAQWLDDFYSDVNTAAEQTWDPEGAFEVDDCKASDQAPVQIDWDA